MAFTIRPLRNANPTFDYATCTIEELQRFIKDRIGAPAVESADVESCTNALESLTPEGRHIESCIKALLELDSSAQFRFLSLPMELRLLVYDELLDYSHQNDRAWKSISPQILATNKQIHREASDLMRHNLRSTTLIHISAADNNADFSHVPTLRLGLSPPIKIKHIMYAEDVARCYPIHDVQAPRVVMVLHSYRKAFEHLCSLPALIARSGYSSVLMRISHGTFELEATITGDRADHCKHSDEKVIASLQLPISAGSTSVTIQGPECKHLDWLRAEISTRTFVALIEIEQEMSKMLVLLERAGLSITWVAMHRGALRRVLPKSNSIYGSLDWDTTRKYLPMLNVKWRKNAVSAAQILLASNDWQQLKAKAEISYKRDIRGDIVEGLNSDYGGSPGTNAKYMKDSTEVSTLLQEFSKQRGSRRTRFSRIVCALLSCRQHCFGNWPAEKRGWENGIFWNARCMLNAYSRC